MKWRVWNTGIEGGEGAEKALLSSVCVSGVSGVNKQKGSVLVMMAEMLRTAAVLEAYL